MTTQTREHEYAEIAVCWCEPELVQPHIDEEGSPSQYAFGWRHHYEGHRCQCQHCVPGGFGIDAERESTWNVSYPCVAGRWPKCIEIDCEDAGPYVSAIREGEDGWILRFAKLPGTEEKHACEQCFEGGCQELIRGLVKITEYQDQAWCDAFNAEGEDD